jgi:hypothetical protein
LPPRGYGNADLRILNFAQPFSARIFSERTSIDDRYIRKTWKPNEPLVFRSVRRFFRGNDLGRLEDHRVLPAFDQPCSRIFGGVFLQAPIFDDVSRLYDRVALFYAVFRRCLAAVCSLVFQNKRAMGRSRVRVDMVGLVVFVHRSRDGDDALGLFDRLEYDRYGFVLIFALGIVHRLFDCRRIHR